MRKKIGDPFDELDHKVVMYLEDENISDKESMRQFNYYGQTRLGDFNENDIEGL